MTQPATESALTVEQNGINTVPDAEHKGQPRELFWPWFAANISVLGIAYGAYLLNFKVSFWQAVIVGIVGILVSFLLCGLVALSGKRGHAPTMTLSRAAFGVNGNRLPSLISWLLTVGWETVLCSLAVLATSTVFSELGWSDGTATKIISMIVVAALIVGGGVIGFDFVMKLQQWITIITAVLTVVYVLLVVDQIHWSTVSAIPAGGAPQVIGGAIFMATGFGLGWVNAAGDYSRYLPSTASSKGVVGWTTLGGALGPIILLIIGLLLVGSSQDLGQAINNDPIGALASILPNWFLLIFLVVAILGLIGGAVLDIYSSGLALMSVGVKVPRPVAAGIDGTIMILGTIYFVFIADNFFYPFQGFLITLGVPISAWCGVFLADLLLRHKGYASRELFDPHGRYGNVNWISVGLVVVGTIVGWGLVTNTAADWLHWQGYLLGPIGGKKGDWAGANLGVVAALLIGFLGYLLLGRNGVRRQESIPLDESEANLDIEEPAP